MGFYSHLGNAKGMLLFTTHSTFEEQIMLTNTALTQGKFTYRKETLYFMKKEQKQNVEKPFHKVSFRG